MSNRKTDYLIIGNSAAGVTAAETIRRKCPSASITIVGEEPYPVYGRPLISYLIEGKTDEGHIGFKDPEFYSNNSIDALLGPEFKAVELLPKEQVAKLANGDSVEYEKCLMATGSIPFTPPITGLDGRSNVYTFMNLDDAKSAWKATVEATEKAHEEGRESRVVVIGAGLIGLKAAESLSHHADDVVVLELAPRILPAVLDDEGAEILQKMLAERGIRAFPGITAQQVRGEGDRATSIQLTDDSVIECDVIIAAVGVRPNSELAINAGAEAERGLVCDEHLQTSLPSVYAAGDVVQVSDALDGSKHPLALWPNAMRQGKVAGLAMAQAADEEIFESSFAVNAVDFFDASLLTAGLINPMEGSGCNIETRVTDDSYSKFVFRDDHLVGYILLNQPLNAGLYTAMIEQRIPLYEVNPAAFSGAPENLDFDASLRWQRLHKDYPEDRNKLGWKKVS